MFGQGMFGAQWFAASCCCHDVPPPTPTPSSGAGDIRPADMRERYDRRDDDDDVAMITALLDL